MKCFKNHGFENEGFEEEGFNCGFTPSFNPPRGWRTSPPSINLRRVNFGLAGTTKDESAE